MGEYQMDQYTVSLLHFNGNITDESGKVWTAVNGAATSTAQSKFGGSSLYLNGSGEYLTCSDSTDFDFGAGDFTVDWWDYRLNAINGQCVLSRTSSGHCPYVIGYTDGSSILFYASSDGGSWDIASGLSCGSVILNEWTHYAVTRHNGTFYTFQNGILIATKDSSTAIPAGGATIYMGTYEGGYFFNGYIDEFRISNIARWIETFEPGWTPNLHPN